MGLATAFVVIMLITPAVFGAQFPVDWSLSNSFSSWTTMPLNEGDTLVFKYDGSHSVDIVSQSEFAQCDSSNPLMSNNISPTVITLRAGTTHIICGTPGHCSAGMKLQVTAKASSVSSGTPPPATRPPPSPPVSVSPKSPPMPPPKTPAVPSSPPMPPPKTPAVPSSPPVPPPKTPAVDHIAPSPSPAFVFGSSPIAPTSTNGAAGSLLRTGGFGFGLVLLAILA